MFGPPATSSSWNTKLRNARAAGEFVRRYGGHVVPFLNDRAARAAYGVTFSRAWRQWRASLETRYRTEADSLRAVGLTEPEVLTKAAHAARVASGNCVFRNASTA